MSEPIIQVKNLSKRYRIGAKEQGHKTFREAIIDGITAPIRNVKRLRKLTKFDDSPSKEQRAKSIVSNTTVSAPCSKPHASDAMPHAVSALRSSQSDDVIWALRDVSFDVQRGEVLGIIGRNGAGKTTLLKILGRITEPTTGEAKIYGRVSSLLEVGTGFHPELTGRENIYLNGTILGMRKAEIDRKFDEIVDFAEIERFINTPVKRYSSGMYVRLAFSVAAHLKPEILLVDEVLAVGDAGFQRKCLGKMGDAAKEGRTVLFVSHNMGAIQQLTTHCIFLDKGTIAYKADVREAVQRYLNLDGLETQSVNNNLRSNLDKFNIVSFSFNKSKLEYGFNKPLYFEIELYLEKAFSNLRIHFGIVNMLGCRILTAKNFIKKLTKGHKKIEFILEDHHLPSGNYSVDLYLRGLSEFFAKERVISFELSEIGIDDSFAIKRKDSLGAFYSPRCKILEIDCPVE